MFIKELFEDHLFSIPRKNCIKYLHINESEADGIEWVVQFHLPSQESEYDDDMYETPPEEVVLTAKDETTAVRYAEQYIRMMSNDDDTWNDAKILSIDQR